MREFNSVLPGVRGWIEKTFEENQDQAVPVINLAFPRPKKVFTIQKRSDAIWLGVASLFSTSLKLSALNAVLGGLPFHRRYWH